METAVPVLAPRKENEQQTILLLQPNFYGPLVESCGDLILRRKPSTKRALSRAKGKVMKKLTCLSQVQNHVTDSPAFA